MRNLSSPQSYGVRRIFSVTFFWLAAVVCAASFSPARAQEKTVWTDQEKPIVQQLRGMRALPDDVRAYTTKKLALDIRKLPPGAHKVNLALALAGLSTEGDFGRETLQEVTTTLAEAVKETPVREEKGEPAAPYIELAELAHYEGMQVALDTPQFTAALKKMEEADKRRAQADFALQDLQGKTWKLKELKGKVVLVNFWATWCPPCRKEMPDLEKLYKKYEKDGLIILAISDEEAGKVSPFITQERVTYPVLLDPGRKVNDEFEVMGIPKSFVFDREGKLVAQSIDMRTEHQFLEMLKQAGLK